MSDAGHCEEKWCFQTISIQCTDPPADKTLLSQANLSCRSRQGLFFPLSSSGIQERPRSPCLLTNVVLPLKNILGHYNHEDFILQLKVPQKVKIVIFHVEIPAKSPCFIAFTLGPYATDGIYMYILCIFLW